MPEQTHGEVIVYQSEDGLARVEVLMENDTVWLSKNQMAELFQRDRTNIGRHIQSIFREGEVDDKCNVQKMHVPFSDKAVAFYSLDMIIAVGYRVKSQRGTQFRQWATARLKEYMQKGFTLDDERLKGNGGGSYWKELLDRIRDIRSSEKMLYRQVLDLYATSVDYDPHSEDSVCFFQIVQNKLHYAAHGHTAAEVIYQRANAEQPFMGLRTFSGDLPVLRDVAIAKNYLDEQELMTYLAETYSAEAEYPFPRDQVSCVFRHGGNRKWFALVMRVPYHTLDMNREGVADILNIKCDPFLIGSLRGRPGFLPAYHMNKDKWLTVLLDGSVDREEITGLVALSYDLTKSKAKPQNRE